VKSTLIKLPEEQLKVPVVEEDNEAAEQAELQAQIAQLPIENSLPLNEFLNLNNETVLDKDKDIFTSVVEHYSVDQTGEQSESSDGEEVKEVDTVEALRYVKQLKIWKLQKGNSQDL
jgi:hypothetical protein